MKKGKFIVIYGANNIGKTTQTSLLVERLRRGGIRRIEVMKYPVYELEPTGPKLNAVLRQGEKMENDELQQLFAQNRRDYEPELKKNLKSGVWVIAEDYKGTGIAWGLANGIKLRFLEKINNNLLKEDLAILLDGKRFREAAEAGHRNESHHRDWIKAKKAHQKLAKRYGWVKIRANGSRQQVSDRIYHHVIKLTR